MPYNDTLVKIKWDKFITDIIDCCDKSDTFKKRLKDLLKPLPVITISSYRKIYEIEAEEQWKQLKSKNRDLFSSFFQRMYIQLEIYGIEKVEKDYNNNLHIMAEVLGKDYDDIRSKIISLNYFLKSNDTKNAEKIKEDLKQYYKKFVILSKKRFIDEYVDKRLNSIKKYFSKISSNNSLKQMTENEFINVIKSRDNLYGKLLNGVNANFNINLSNLDFERMIISILNKQDEETYKILNIKKPEFYDDIKQMKSFRRLRANYVRKIKENIKPELYGICEKYLNSPLENKNLKSYFSQEQILFLNDIINLMKESKSIVDFNNDMLFVSEYKEFTKENKKELEKFNYNISIFNEIKKIIFDMYIRENETYNELYKIVEEDVNNKELSGDIIFNDSNFELTDFSYAFNEKIIKNFISKLEEESFLSLNNYEYMKLKDLLISDKLLAPMLYDNLNQAKLYELINNFHNIYSIIDYSLINKSNLDLIFKKLNVYKYANEKQINMLGLEVVEKIINSNQFMDVKVTDDDIKERLVKAEDLLNRAETVTLSTVPYIDVNKNGVYISRYLNNDPKILTSGIDTNSCFKLSANDNDFLYYTILNKNGFVIKFTNKDGKLLGKAIGIRRNNILEINGIRNSDNSNLITSKEQYTQYKNMLEAFDLYATKIIEETKDTNTPIDFVVSNKAGLLESSEFNDRYEILGSHLFDNPIDTTNEDWYKFVHTYDGCKKNYLQQASDNTIFTTDFGHYPVVMIKKRDGKNLERLFDISYDDPEAIYERPDSRDKVINNYIDSDFIRKVKGV